MLTRGSVAFGWVHRAAHILGQVEFGGTAVRNRLSGLLGAMARHRESVGALSSAVDHFVKVSRSYWPGLFGCYDTPGLPRTNNDLERAFGSHRYHERRVERRRFRRDPDGYLKALENKLIQSRLPS